MFTIPLGFTIPVALLIVSLAVLGVKPSLVSSPDVPLTYITSPSAAETVLDKIMAKNSVMSISKVCFCIFSPPLCPIDSIIRFMKYCFLVIIY